MGQVGLTYDPTKALFSLAVHVIVSDETPAKMGPVEMYVDTGSNTSFIAEDAATSMGLRLEGRDTQMTSGIAGIGGAPVLRRVTVVLLDATTIDLPQVLVMRPPARQDRRNKGGFRTSREFRVDPVSLFGLDAVRKLRGRLQFDLSTDPPTATLEW